MVTSEPKRIDDTLGRRRNDKNASKKVKPEWLDSVDDKSVINVALHDVDSKMKDEVNPSLLPDSPPRSEMKDEDLLTEAELDQKRSSSSRQTSPEATESPRNGTTVKLGKGPTQFASHLPRADNAALATFEQLKGNLYQNAKVGRSKGHKKEAMICECRYRLDMDDPIMACTDEAGCINRLTQIECLRSDCNCGQYCQNQRFQRGEYADLEIVQTEKKGFGLRAGSPLPADTFIYEYIGEVVEQKEFMRRMQQYKEEGIRHFYFMMLQREEFLDATRKGAVARFVNHSCNPNCYVSKWHVGKYMRMGIFAKRGIQEGEELTFNYNVDRYGNDAQPCYCGEPNCVGSIGGKTQTDIGGMDELIIDALGISEQVEALQAKGTRRKKSKHLDEDFIPLLRPIEEEEVAKVITAVRQSTSNRSILHKLLHRIHITQDTIVQRCLVRLHGFVLMASVIEEWKDDKEVVLLAMGSLARWPLLAKNKVVDSGIDRLIQDLSEEGDAEVSSLASDLLGAWEALEMSYRIARKDPSLMTEASMSSTSEVRRATTADDDELPRQAMMRLEDARAPNSVSNRLEAVAPKPLGKSQQNRYSLLSSIPRDFHEPHESPSTPRTSDEHHSHSTWAASNGSGRYRPHKSHPLAVNASTPDRPVEAMVPKAPPPTPLSIEEIIRKANESEALQRKQAEEAKAAELKAKAEAERAMRGDGHSSINGSSKRRHSPNVKKDESPEKRMRDSDENLSETASDVAERRLKKAVGEIVVRCMSLHKDNLDRDTFKKHARELTHIICGKEKRSAGDSWPPKGSFADGLSKEKTKKIKSFAMDYVQKLVARKAKAGSKGENESAAASAPSATASISTPETPPRPPSYINEQRFQAAKDVCPSSEDIHHYENGRIQLSNQTSLDQE